MNIMKGRSLYAVGDAAKALSQGVWCRSLSSLLRSSMPRFQPFLRTHELSDTDRYARKEISYVTAMPIGLTPTTVLVHTCARIRDLASLRAKIQADALPALRIVPSASGLRLL
jgi:hypothetical protein